MVSLAQFKYKEELFHEKHCKRAYLPKLRHADDPADQFGRHADGTANADYCIYCCPNGEEAMTGTLDEMIDFCVPIEVRLGLFPNEPAARKALSEYLPTLKRWKK